MKRFFKWLAKVIGSAVTLVLVIVLLPYASRLAARYMPDESGAAIKASAVLSSKLAASARLETMTAQEEGVIHYDVKAALIGSVAEINISYRYEASFGVDLRQVQMQARGSELTFLLPEPVALQDSITPTETYRDDFWYPGFSDADHQRLLEEERLLRRNAYLNGEHAQALWDATIAAFEQTVAPWLTEVDGSLTFRYEHLPAEPTETPVV